MSKNKTTIYSIIIIFMLSIFTLSNSQTLKYKESRGTKTSKLRYFKTIVGGKIKITLSKGNIRETCIVDTNYHCLKWIYIDRNNGYNFIAERSSNTIKIFGKIKGKEFKNSTVIGNKPWIQFWGYGLKSLASRKKSVMKFYSINAKKPKKGAHFIARNKGREIIKIGKKSQQSTRIEITIKGLPAFIFTAKLWFRTVDKLFIKSKMPEGPFVPITKIEIQNPV